MSRETRVLPGKVTWGETFRRVSVFLPASTKAIELAPSRESTFTALGIFYYEAGRISEAREVLERYSQIFPHGSIDVDRIRQTLDAAPVSGNSGKTVGLSPDARREFYQLALTLAEQDR